MRWGEAVYCVRCGKQLEQEAAFCSSCGAPVNVSIAACDAIPNQAQKSEESDESFQGSAFEGIERDDFCEADAFEAPCESNGRGEDYVGSIRKCPNCGERLEPFVMACPACGYELRGVDKQSRAYELTKRLEKAKTPEQKNDLIKNFYVSNTREDIYEFIILASSNIESGGPEAGAWRAKLDQAYKKAVLVFEEGSELERIRKLYEKANLQHMAKTSVDAVFHNRALQCAVLFVIGVVLRILGEVLGTLPGIGRSFEVLSMISGFLFIAAIVLLFRLVRNRKDK